MKNSLLCTIYHILLSSLVLSVMAKLTRKVDLKKKEKSWYVNEREEKLIWKEEKNSSEKSLIWERRKKLIWKRKKKEKLTWKRRIEVKLKKVDLKTEKTTWSEKGKTVDLKRKKKVDLKKKKRGNFLIKKKKKSHLEIKEIWKKRKEEKTLAWKSSQKVYLKRLFKLLSILKRSLTLKVCGHHWTYSSHPCAGHRWTYSFHPCPGHCSTSLFQSAHWSIKH